MYIGYLMLNFDSFINFDNNHNYLYYLYSIKIFFFIFKSHFLYLTVIICFHRFV